MDETMRECVNLQERFGRQYRISFDPAYSPRHVPQEKRNFWYMLILCRRGEIWPYGGSMLAVELEGRRAATVRRLLATGVCRLYRDGDDGATLLFAAADFETVATIVKPRRRRQVSETERERLRSLSAQHGFQRHQSEQFSGAK